MEDELFMSPEEIANSVANKVGSFNNKNVVESYNENAALKNLLSGNTQRNQIFTGAKTIDINTNYTRLSDGTFTPKYENVIGNYGNEERLAQQQSSGEKWLHGLGKMVAKTGTYAVDATLGTAYGIFSGISEGSWDAVWNNEFSQKMDDLNVRLDGALPNYYTEAEKNMNMFQKLGTANFWADEFFGNAMPFVLSNIVTGAAAAPLKLGTKLPKWFAKSGNLTTKQAIKYQDDLAKAGIKSADDLKKVGAEKFQEIAKLNKNIEGTQEAFKDMNKWLVNQSALTKTGKGIDILAFSVRTGTHEAGMEARHNLNEAMENFYVQFEQMNGRQPTSEEISAYYDDAVSMGNFVFGTNMAILAPSNMIMFGKTLDLGLDMGKPFNSFSNKVLMGKGINVEQVGGKLVAKEIVQNKLQKNIARVNSIFGKAVTEGVYEEGFQGVVGKTMQNYLEAKYDPDMLGKELSLMTSLGQAFEEQYGTKEGWNEMFVGMLVGGVGAPLAISTSQGKPGQFFSEGIQNITQRGTNEANKEAAEAYNKLMTPIHERISSLASLYKTVDQQHILAKGVKIDGEKTNEPIDYNKALTLESMANYDYIRIMEGHKTYSEMLEDYEFLMKNTEWSKELQDKGVSEEDFNQYKADLLTNFKKDLDATKRVKRVAEGLNYEYKDSEGNKREIKDVLARTYYEGMTALRVAEQVGQQLDEAFGATGSFETLHFMANLSKEQSDMLATYNENKAKIAQKQRLSIELKKRAEEQKLRAEEVRGRLGSRNKPAVAASENAYNTRLSAYQATANEIVKLDQEINDLQNKMDTAKESLAKLQKMENVDLQNTFGFTPDGLVGYDVEQMIEQFDNLSNYTEQLRANGKTKEADAIEALMDDFAISATKARTMATLQREMLDPKFFMKPKGRKMVKDIKGSTYTMSEEFKKQLDDNNERVLNVLRSRSKVQNIDRNLRELVEFNVQNNTNLSEREKFRMEAIIKAQLLQANILNTALVTEEIDGVQSPSHEVKAGDNAELSTKIQEIREDKTLTNSQQLRKLINLIKEQVNSIFEGQGREVTQDDIDTIQKKYNVTITKKEDGTFEVTPNIEKEAKEGEYKKVEDLAERIKRGEQTTEAEDLQLQDTYPKYLESLLNDENLEEAVNQAKAELDAIENPGFTVFETKDFNRLYDLIGRQETGEELTDDELAELERLKDHFDRWTMAEGTVVNGIKLSDLMRRVKVYESLSAQAQDDIFSLEGFEAMALSEFETRGAGMFYYILQSPVNSTVITESGGVSIQNISAGALAASMGQNVTASVQNPEPGTQTEFTIITDSGQENIVANVNERGNLVFSQADIDLINQNTNLIVAPTNQKLATRYSILLQRNTDGTITPVKTDYTYNNETVNEEAILDLKPEDELTVRVDLTDPYNQKLLEEANLPDLQPDQKTKSDFDDEIGELKAEKDDLNVEKQEIKARTQGRKQNPKKEAEIITEIEENLKENDELISRLNNDIELTENEISDLEEQIAKVKSEIPDVTPRTDEGKAQKLAKQTELQELEARLGQLNSRIDYFAEQSAIRESELTAEAETIYEELGRLNNRLDEIKSREKEISLGLSVLEAQRKAAPKTKQAVSEEDEETLNRLADNMVIGVYKGNTLIGVFKANRGVKQGSQREIIFEQARHEIIKNNREKLTDGSTEILPNITVKAGDIFLGHPSYNFTVDADNNLSTEFKDIPESQRSKISDVGVFDGKNIRLKNNTQGVDTTYLAKLDTAGKNQPIVVLDYRGKKVAFPANVKGKDKTELIERLESILDGNLPHVEKGIQADAIMAELGIDPNIPGNSLEHIHNGDNTFNEDNFNKLLGKAKDSSYLYTVEDWFKEDLSLETIVANQLQMNIDLSEPFHSPKVPFDFVNFTPTVPTAPQQQKKNKQVKQQSVKSTNDSIVAANDIAKQFCS